MIRYIVRMDGPAGDGRVIEVEEEDMERDGFWQDIEGGAIAKPMPRGTTRADANAELAAWLASINT